MSPIDSLFARHEPRPTAAATPSPAPLPPVVASGAADPLTGLGDRRSLAVNLEKGEGHAVVVIDLDDFRAINEALGHHVGDMVLVECARRLRSVTGSEATVSRIGDDEFALLVPPTVDPLAWAERTRDAMRVPLMIDGRPHAVMASIGVATADELPVNQLLQAADGAVDRAKERGGDRVEVYDPVLLKQAQRRNEIEQDLRRGIEARQIRVHYQPQVSLASGLICGIEALVRWERPGHGLVYPGGFIDVAERNGLIKQLGEVVLRQACTDALGLLELSKVGPEFTVSVNVSTSQLHDQAFIATLESALRTTGLPPRHLVLEITESAVLGSSLRVERVLSTVREMGAQFSIDDFGTGYSSLSHLRRLPVDELKIDRSFVLGMADPAGRELVGAICAIARALDLRTVAEGVEDETLVAELRTMGCDVVQGFVYFRPEPLDKVRKAVRKDRPRR